ncbi:MAG: type IV secretory system conjugative DNA transfer family protein [Saccharofermentans sp.]|nr:type IV secretory system conjugative DNA transfer family protein [Saccharofermentans sp.]
MEQGKPKSHYFRNALILAIIPLYLGVIAAQYMPVKYLVEHFKEINWLHIEMTKDTPAIVLAFMTAYICLVLWWYDPGHYRNDAFGSAHWISPSQLSKYKAKENKEYRKALKPWNLRLRTMSHKGMRYKLLLPRTKRKIESFKPVTSYNRILSQNVQFDINTRTSKCNANTIGIGNPGSYKTTSLIYTNIMNLSGSIVICDPKGESTLRCAPLGLYMGYDVKVVDLQQKERSARFNPFRYVKTEEDIVSMISFTFRGFDVEKKGGNKDPFWDDANMLEMCAIAYLLWFDARPEDQTLTMIVRLVNLNSLEITRYVAQGTDEHGKPKYATVKKTALDWIFEDYKRRHGEWNLPMDYYRMFRKAKDKTLSNMETTLVSKMQLLLQPSIERIMSEDDLNLEDVGRKETLLFLKIPDSDGTYNFIVSLVYMFLYKSLYYISDVEEKGNGCRVPVTLLQDEFTSFPQPDNYLDLMAGCRSRNIGMFPIFQDMAKLKNMKCLGDGWKSIFGQVDSGIFLGGAEEETCKYVSDNWLGKETVTYRTSSKNGFSTNKTGKNLMDAAELNSMPKDKCVIWFNHEGPCIDSKYNFLKHPNINFTAIPRDGSGLPFYDPIYPHENIKTKKIKNDSTLNDAR